MANYPLAILTLLASLFTNQPQVEEISSQETNEDSNIYIRYTDEIVTSSEWELSCYRSELTKEAVLIFYDSYTHNRSVTNAIIQASERYDIAPSLIFALVRKESGFIPNIQGQNSTTVDRGLFQLNSSSFPDLSEEQFFDPYINADRGVKFFKQCMEIGGSEVAALAMYNAGPGAVSSNRTPLVTLNYISTIFEHQEEISENFRRTMLMNDTFFLEGDKNSKNLVYLLERNETID